MPINHTVALGDCCSCLAHKYKLASHATLHDDGANAELKKKRPNPNVLAVGDVVVIPDKVEKKESAPTDKSTKFEIKLPKATLKILLQEEFGALKELKGKKYKLTVGSDVFEGKVPADGKIEHPIPLDTATGTLELWLKEGAGIDGYLLDLDIGALEHESVTAACQARLLNLGYDCGGTGGALDDPTKDALEAFKKKNGLTADGVLDDATRSKLRTVHEGV